MKSISIQFHSTIEELLSFFQEEKVKLDLDMALLKRDPFSIDLISEKVSPEDFNGVSKVAFSLDGFSTDAANIGEFNKVNKDAIYFDIGHLSQSGLDESAMLFMSSEEKYICVANKIASDLKKITKAGARAVGLNGMEVNLRTHRYTMGARALYLDGVEILPVAGNNRILLEK